MTRENTRVVSEFLGWANEKQRDWTDNQNKKEREMDDHNNRCGNEIGENAKSTSDCQNKCMDALKNDRLKYYSPGRPLNGPGYWY